MNQYHQKVRLLIYAVEQHQLLLKNDDLFPEEQKSRVFRFSRYIPLYLLKLTLCLPVQYKLIKVYMGVHIRVYME